MHTAPRHRATAVAAMSIGIGAIMTIPKQQIVPAQLQHMLVIFAGVAAAAAFANALIGLVAYANDRRYEVAVHGLIGAPARVLRREYVRKGYINACIALLIGVPLGAFVVRAWRTDMALLAAGIALAISYFAASISSARYKKPGWLGDALSPEARTIPGYGAEDLRAFLNTAQLSAAIALSIVGVLIWSATALPEGPQARNDVFVARAHGTYVKTLDAETIASPGALLGVGDMPKVLTKCGRCFRGNMILPFLPVEAQQHNVGPGFFAIAGVRVLHGREFNADDVDSVIVNHAFVQNGFDTSSPIGRAIQVGGLSGKWYKIVGVVDDIPTVGINIIEAVPNAPVHLANHIPAIYFLADPAKLPAYDVVVKSPARPLQAGLAFEPLAAVFERAMASQRWFAKMIMLVGALMCAATLGGSVITLLLSVQSRREEFAIRRAVGARRWDIRMLVFRSTGAMLLRALIIGAALGAALSRAVPMH
ncbi:MAG TPA: FtsX-like permease family protein [Longimicrobiales bacterium]|nr:FtsX-like permease family protein [Longimicrobiales bacterium]